jgi:hypothetical protein
MVFLAFDYGPKFRISDILGQSHANRDIEDSLSKRKELLQNYYLPAY